MSRIHAFEFEDFPWFPEFLRNYMTDFLQTLANLSDFFKPVVPVIERGLDHSGGNTIIDLASGGGGGLVRLAKHLMTRRPDIDIVLTDYFPNLDAFRYTAAKLPCFRYEEHPVNALNVPTNLVGLRTQFLSFHHFTPEQAQQILQNAVDTGSPIAIFEAQERSVQSVVAMLFSPITVLLVTPFIRPFRIGRIVFTYFIPLVPLFIWWDGIVSALRTYSVREMQSLVDSLQNKDTFVWEIKRLKSGPGVVLYLLGHKK
ncbi:class I SAM-dependent methyltransferase [Chryseolinea lacunae]|uniref:Class I SAM-dependent methyltransferase n=1 Tax=Chryseolinea lacunae TaxID=2801331 RepID=A0ABS1L1B5_9BACT|nr:class I SAM-dependent methyltransferase [Chryseolinea lacunae]MBL0745243.1 hypothetical protein [Chryseolinea lacunae]